MKKMSTFYTTSAYTRDAYGKTYNEIRSSSFLEQVAKDLRKITIHEIKFLSFILFSGTLLLLLNIVLCITLNGG